MIEQDAIFWYNKMKRTNIACVLLSNPRPFMLTALFDIIL